MRETAEKVKTVKLSVSVWKSLMLIKLDKGKSSVDEVIKEYVEKEGY